METLTLPIYQEVIRSRNKVYSSDRMSPPPSESPHRVIQFELTTGCSHNACTYCDQYKGVPFKKKGLWSFKRHVNSVWSTLEENSPGAISGLERIFIGSGDALSVDSETLNKAISYSIKSFVDYVGKNPRRVAIYGSTKDILEKGRAELRELNCGGNCGNCSIDRFGEKLSLGVLYWGMETGSGDVLKYIKKGHDEQDLFDAISQISRSGIRCSVNVMPGLGGIKYSDSHVDRTAEALNKLCPEFITFLAIEPKPGTQYTEKMNRETLEGTNRPLTTEEICEQTARMIERLGYFSTTIGMHGKDITPIANNPVSFGSVKIDRNPYAFARLAYQVRNLSESSLIN